jgi:hypothetical protein
MEIGVSLCRFVPVSRLTLKIIKKEKENPLYHGWKTSRQFLLGTRFPYITEYL